MPRVPARRLVRRLSLAQLERHLPGHDAGTSASSSQHISEVPTQMEDFPDFVDVNDCND